MSLSCLSSQYQITIKKGASAYRYNVDIVLTTAKQTAKNLTETVDRIYRDRNDRLIASLKELKDVKFVYDKMRILWTSQPLKKDINVVYNIDDLPKNIGALFGKGGSVEVSISANLQQPRLDLSDFSQYQKLNFWREEDHTLRTVLELLTTYPAAHAGFVETKNGIYGPEQPFERGLVIRLGCKKGVQFIQNGQNVQPVLTMDTQKKVFYPSGKNFLAALKEYGCNGNNYAEVAKFYNGVLLRSKHNPERVLKFKRFGKNVLREAKLDTENTSLVNFFKNKYNITLCQVNVPTALMKNAHGEFPLELLEILPGQDVSPGKLPQDLGDQQKSMNIIKPAVRYDDLQTLMRSLNFDNPTLKAFGCSVSPNMLQVKFTFLPAPKIFMKNNPEIIPDPKSRMFRFGRDAKFVVPGRVTNWAVVSESRSQQVAQQFADRLKNISKFKGLELKMPLMNSVNSTRMTAQQWENFFTDLRNRSKVDYVLIVDGNDGTHDNIKAAESNVQGLVTQHVHYKTANKVATSGAGATVENILLKVDMKNAGLNYKVIFPPQAKELDIGNNWTLVIGLDVAHPTGENHIGEQTQPSVVGFVANYGKDPSEFLGDYAFQDPRQEQIDEDILSSFMEKVFMALRTNKRNKPTHIVVLRDGLSEGQYRMAVDTELQSIKNALGKFYATGPPAKYIHIMLSKKHNTRHFVKSNDVFSLQPGSFIDDGARKDMVQFYYTAHRAIQGSSQSVLTTVLVNDAGVSKDCIKHFIHALCYHHQIVGLPVSLPAPVYQASELAKRGTAVYKASIRNVVDSKDYKTMYQQLSFGKGTLPMQRFTA